MRSSSRSPSRRMPPGRRPPARSRKSVAPTRSASFIAIDGDGMVTIYSGKVELGTGALTAITQIAAEELSVRFDRVATIQGDTELTPNQGPTYASLSIQNGGMQIRRAAATAREALLDLAASQLGVADSPACIHERNCRPSVGRHQGCPMRNCWATEILHREGRSARRR